MQVFARVSMYVNSIISGIDVEMILGFGIIRIIRLNCPYTIKAACLRQLVSA